MDKLFKPIFILSLVFLILLASPSFGSRLEFSDVKEDSWFYEPVMSLSARGLIKGYPDGSFRPKDNISLGEFLKLIMTASNNRTYEKLDGRHWAYDVYLDAVTKAVIDSSNFRGTSEALNAPLTREDMAYILIGVSENILGEKKPLDKSKLPAIKDLAHAKDLTRESILLAYDRGLVNGKNGSFDPKGNLTRAEASTIIVRLLDKDKRIK